MNWNDDQKKWNLVDAPKVPKLLPVTADGEERVWKWGVERTLRELRDLRIVETDDGKEIQKKLRMIADLNLPFTIWDEPDMSASEQGTTDIVACFGNKDFFSFPKSKYAVRKCIFCWYYPC